MEKVKTAPVNTQTRKKLIAKTGIQIITAAAAFMLGSVSFDGRIFPFGIALAGGVSDQTLLAACLGTSLSALVFSPPSAALKYTSASILLLFLRNVTKKRFTKTSFYYVYPLITFFSVLVCSLIFALAFGYEGAQIIPEICDAVIAGACALFVYRVERITENGAFTGVTTAADTASCMLLGFLLLLSVERVDFGGFSPARPAAFLAVMLSAYGGKESAGAMAGVCAGTLFGLSEANPHLLLSLPLAGLVCGSCSEHGKTAVGAAFAAVGTLALILRGNAETAVTAVVEYASASLLFVLMPARVWDRLTDKLLAVVAPGMTDDSRQRLALRIKRSAKAVRDMAYSVEAVCRMLSRSDKPDMKDVPQDVKEDVCADCLKRDFCWKNAGGITMSSFRDCLRVIEEKGRLTPDHLPERLSIVCREKNALCDSFNRLVCECNARLTARAELFEAKALAASQFRCAADIMEDAAEDAVRVCDHDARLTAAAAGVFRGFGFECSSLLVSGQKNGRRIIEAFCTRCPETPDYNALVRRLEEKTDIRFMPPVTEDHKKEGRLLTFCEQTPLAIRYHKTSRAGDGEKLCGDSCEAFSDGRGNFYCVLSDGMGTGSRAALDSAMTSSIYSKLMKAGFTMPTAFSAVSSALAVKSADEAMATLDILRIDLFTGEAEICKAGAAFTVVNASGSVDFIEKASMPIGIIRDTSPEYTRFRVKKGDTVIMLSDGAEGLGMSFFRRLFLQHGTASASPGEICRITVEAAAAATPSGRIDDITAVCVRIV